MLILWSIIILLYSSANDAIYLNTTSGLVRGHTIHVVNRSVHEFLAIPYAEPPIGELRFAKPKPITVPIRVSYVHDKNE